MVDEDIVYDPTIRPAEQRICCLVMTNGGNVLRSNELEKIERVFSQYLDFAHVADVEQASSSTNRIVFADNTGVLNRHLPTAECNHPRAHCDVSIIEWCSPKWVSCHPMISFC